MKHISKFLLIISLIFALTNIIVARVDIPQDKFKSIETNLLQGLQSDNIGLKVSSAYMLGEIKSERAVLPLTKLMRDAGDERVRFVAALSLIKIGTTRSIYVVKQGKRFNNYASVRNLCKNLYSSYLWAQYDKMESDKNVILSFAARN